PQPLLAPEEAGAALETGPEMGLAGAGFPAGTRLGRAGGPPNPLQAQLIRRAQRHQGNFAVQRMLKRAAAPLPESHTGEELAERIARSSGGGRALEPNAQAQLETGLRADLDDVRVHTDAEAAEMAEAVDAVAFTSGRDIFFGPGEYQPATSDGLELLAHEAAHTVQQAAGPVDGAPAEGGVLLSHPSDPFEQAAEKLAHEVARVAT